MGLALYFYVTFMLAIFQLQLLAVNMAIVDELTKDNVAKRYSGQVLHRCLLYCIVVCAH